MKLLVIYIFVYRVKRDRKYKGFDQIGEKIQLREFI